ncbi:hypothetical protein CRG98_030474 [Punica granatum]|uniref:SWIM-type domain-containing protein n=1 Tax=Punica granatum TaxID=22663 RepID=A0A2I0IYP6_PUNGR|nr:hypothetical protein CRG98_030474 [Punica granatum]
MGGYRIKTFYPTHTCSRVLKHPLADRKWVGKKIVDAMRSYPNITAKDVAKFMAYNYQIKEINEGAWIYLKKFDVHHWTRAAFSTSTKNPVLVNNVSEQFNAAAVKFRGQPIITIVEDIKEYLTVKMNNSRREIESYHDPITPAAQTKLEDANKHANKWHPMWVGDPDGSMFQVLQIYSPSEKFVVDLNKNSCSCREWDLSGIPCYGTVAYICHNGQQPKMFVHAYFSKKTWHSIYTPFIHSVRGHAQWEKSGLNPILPPQYGRGSGRPKKKRDKKKGVTLNPYKVKRKYKGTRRSKYGNTGHNKTRCTRTTVREKKQKTTKANAKDKGKSVDITQHADDALVSESTVQTQEHPHLQSCSCPNAKNYTYINANACSCPKNSAQCSQDVQKFAQLHCCYFVITNNQLVFVLNALVNGRTGQGTVQCSVVLRTRVYGSIGGFWEFGDLGLRFDWTILGFDWRIYGIWGLGFSVGLEEFVNLGIRVYGIWELRIRLWKLGFCKEEDRLRQHGVVLGPTDHMELTSHGVVLFLGVREAKRRRFDEDMTQI